jgi:hypothetical protein
MDMMLSIPAKFWNTPSIANKIGALLSHSHLYEIQHPYIRDLLVKSIEANPTLESLWYPAALTIAADETADARTNLRALSSKVIPQETELSPYPQIAVAVAKLASCIDECQGLDEVLAYEESTELLSTVLSGEILPIEKRLSILNLVIKQLREKNSLRWERYIPIARKALDTRKSDLTNPIIWNDKLEFPSESFGILLPVVMAAN